MKARMGAGRQLSNTAKISRCDNQETHIQELSCASTPEIGYASDAVAKLEVLNDFTITEVPPTRICLPGFRLIIPHYVAEPCSTIATSATMHQDRYL